MAIFTSKYNGTCGRCRARISAGEPIRYENKAVVGCTRCDSALQPTVRVSGRVRVQQVRFASDKPWTVASVTATVDMPPFEKGYSFGLVGAFHYSNLRAGDLLDVEGAVVDDPKWGLQLKADSAVRAVDGSDEAVLAFLARFPNVGQQRAEAILRELGGREATLDALRNDPAKLAQVKGITAERAQAIAAQYLEEKDVEESLLFLGGLGLTPGMQAKLIDEYGPDAKQVILDDPYELMDLAGIGFQRADEIARKLEVSLDDPRRIAASVRLLLDRASNDGHTWSSFEDLLKIS